MDMNSPGADSKPQDGGAKVTKFSSRMDSLLATLKQDIKALRCQGDQVSETMWNLYQTFEDVLYERSTFLCFDEKICDENTEDGDSGVATATEDGGEEFHNTKYLSRNEPSHGNCLNDDSGENDKYVRPRAWYELDDEDDDDDDGENEEETPQNKTQTRNGLTEEWIKYGHFQLTGKHYEMTGEKDIADRDSDTIQYDWGSFSDDDEVATLPYDDWEVLEEHRWSNNDHSESPIKGHQQMYRIEDQKVVPNNKGHYQTCSNNNKVDREHSNNYNKTTSNNWETNTTTPSSRGTLQSCENNTAMVTCKGSYNVKSSRSSPTHSRSTSTQTNCNQKDVDIVCTCERFANMRAFDRPIGKHRDIDTNNNENARKTTHQRIMTNGTLSSIRKKKHDEGIVGNVRATNTEFDDDNKRTLMRAFSERIPRVSSTASLPNNTSPVHGAHVHPDITQHFNYRRRSLTNIAGNRQPLVLGDIDRNFTENIISKTEGMVVNFNDQRYSRNNSVKRSPSDGKSGLTIGDNRTEPGVGSNWVNRRTTWDLGGQDFDLDRELAKDEHGHSHIDEKRSRLRTTYHGPILPSKAYFPKKEQCLVPSSRPNEAVQPNGMLHAHDKTRRKSNDKETLRMCAIRYVGFKAAWQSSKNHVGKRRSFSGFTVLDKSNHITRRRENGREQLQSTYC